MCIRSFHSLVVSGWWGSWYSGRASSLMTVALAWWYALWSGRGMCVHVWLGASNRSSCVTLSNHSRFFRVCVAVAFSVASECGGGVESVASGVASSSGMQLRW